MNYDKEEKEMWLEDWKQSGKAAWTYAKENGIIPQTFCNWVKREETKKTSALSTSKGFVEITKQYTPVQARVQEIIVEKGAIKIRIPFGICHEELQGIFLALGGVS